MRLLDQVSQASPWTMILEGTETRAMPGAGASADAIRGCSVRYVLDERAAETCRFLAATRLDDLWDIVRMPAPCFWLEWPEGDGRRTGILVTAGDDGRRGEVETFWEQIAGEPDTGQATLRFDLDGHPHERQPSGAAGQRSLPRHLALRAHPPWQRHFFQCGEARGEEALRRVASALLPGAAMLFAFALLLSAPALIEATPVDRTRLNRARRRSARPDLLDHIEVRLDLAAGARLAALTAGAEPRHAARPHQVRGHFVRRGGGVFWRRAHRRGEGAVTLLVRTVCMTSGQVRASDPGDLLR